MEKTKKNIAVLGCSLIFIIIVTYLARFVNLIDVVALRIAALAGLNLLNGFIAYAAMKLTKMKIRIDLKNGRQFFIGALLACMLSLVIAIIPAACGVSLIGNHTKFTWFEFIYELLFCLLIVGPVEEFVFRVYLQDAFVGLFKKRQWIGVIVSAFLFGLWHLINGSIEQVLFTFGIGLVFGFSKYKIRNCGYIGVAFGHGLYDFLNYIVRILIVR